MSYFRSITDSHSNVSKNRYYTLGGYKWGSFGSALYWGGLYLSSYGSNDGVVTVASSRLTGGTIIREGAWNHTTIREGSHTFRYSSHIQCQNSQQLQVHFQQPRAS